MIIYKTKQGPELKVKMEKQTVWLTQAQVALLFGTQRPAITKHLKNIFTTGELDEESVCSILEHTAADGKRYKTQFLVAMALLMAISDPKDKEIMIKIIVLQNRKNVYKII